MIRWRACQGTSPVPGAGLHNLLPHTHSMTTTDRTIISLDAEKISAVNTFFKVQDLEGRTVVRVTKDPKVTAVDEPTFARIAGCEFLNGTIQMQVKSKLLFDAPDYARGFIGIAFRIKPDNSEFECIYIRPTNGRAGDQNRRNSSTQYFSYPEFKYDRLRKEAPGKYESYTDMGLDEWIDVRIEVHADQARLFLHGSAQPSLLVNDLKHGKGAAGGIGLWVDIGTDGLFADVKVKHA